jgi:hypothetical protein
MSKESKKRDFKIKKSAPLHLPHERDASRESVTYITVLVCSLGQHQRQRVLVVVRPTALLVSLSCHSQQVVNVRSRRARIRSIIIIAVDLHVIVVGRAKTFKNFRRHAHVGKAKLLRGKVTQTATAG